MDLDEASDDWQHHCQPANGAQIGLKPSSEVAPQLWKMWPIVFGDASLCDAQGGPRTGLAEVKAVLLQDVGYVGTEGSVASASGRGEFWGFWRNCVQSMQKSWFWFVIFYIYCAIPKPKAYDSTQVLVKTKTTPKNTTFDLLYLNHHNIPTIENLVADTQDVLKQLRVPTY